ncbi:MAG: hypothetical protein IJA21_01410 [Clostridia bacterium]|nr:hypothetical protein [Clostridia bacterium]
MKFKIDYNRLVVLLLPTFLRRPVLFGFLRAAVWPLEQLYNKFRTARGEHNYRLTHNGQVCYLRACLNDHFKSNMGVFDIISVEREGEWLFAVTETGERVPITISEDNISGTENVPIVYNELMLNTEQNEFIVSVPADIYDTALEEVKALVNQYKLISKRAIYVAQSA